MSESGELQQVLIKRDIPNMWSRNLPILFLPWDSHKFIYQSQRDGFNHLYLYNTEGELLKQLTSGPWLVQDIVGFNQEHERAHHQEYGNLSFAVATFTLST